MTCDLEANVELASNSDTSSNHHYQEPLIITTTKSSTDAAVSSKADMPLKVRPVVIFSFLFLTTVATVIGLSQSQNKASSNQEGANIHVEDDAVPAAPYFSISDFVATLPVYSRRALLDPESPQSLSLRWLQDDALAGSYGLARQTQRFALATLYLATQGNESWVEDKHWLTEEDECDWYSELAAYTLVCNEQHQLQALNLRELGLQGQLPPEIGLLSSLVSLRLDKNDLVGTLPSTLEGLTALEYINLSELDLTGRIPLSMSWMTNLETVRLHDNEFIGSLPTDVFSNWRLLDDLDIGLNNLTGSLPANMDALPTSLTGLYLDNNLFTGSLPEELCNLTNLKYLWLHRNSFSGQIPSCLGNLIGLRDLALHANGFTGSVPESLCRNSLNSALTIVIDCHNVSCSCGCECFEEDEGEPETRR